jgi:hypothetical protein
MYFSTQPRSWPLRPPGARRGVGQAALLGANPIGAAVGIAGGLLQIGNLIDNMITNSGCGATCIQATNVVNQAEPLLVKNLQTYLAAPVHYASAQAQALANFDSVWGAVEAACASPALAMAGAHCISDRITGACAYKTSPGGWSGNTYTAPGANGSGSTCWNWFVGYRDPIANDPTVVPDPPAELLSSTLSSLTSGNVAGIPTIDLLIGGGALLLAWLLL